MSDVIVIGAGVFGAWTALELARDGHRVRLIDAYGPGNSRASSADHSRIIRAGYGADAIYSRWATESMVSWRRLAEETGHTLLTRTGAIFMGPPGHEYIRSTYQTLRTLGIEADWLEAPDVAQRFPQIATTGLGPAVLEHNAGVLRARAAVRAAVAFAVEQYGVAYQTACVAPLDEQRADLAVLTTTGERLDADACVLAAGPWLPRLLPQALGGKIRATRQEVLYFGPPAADDRHAADRLPVWIDFASGVYGIPDLDGHGFKVGIDRHGPEIDPDTDDRLVGAAIVEDTKRWLGTRFPGLAAAPLVDARVCQYESTCNGDFVIDRHPAWANVWIAGGGSGHGFKHGPAVGRYVADRIAGRADAEPRFALQTKTTAAERSVY